MPKSSGTKNNTNNKPNQNKNAAQNKSGSGARSSGTTQNKGAQNKNTKNKQAKNKKHWIIRIAAILIIGVILGVSMLFETDINKFLRLKGYIEEDYSGMSDKAAVGDGVVAVGSKLNVHFVDVGQGDACIVELPDDRKMIIDGGADKEKEKLLSYIEENITLSQGKAALTFDFAILTHSDEDHCGGLDDVLKKYSVGTFYRPNQLASYTNFTDPGKSQLTGSVDANAKSTLAYMRVIDAGYKAADKEIVTNAADSSQNKITPAGLSKGDAGYYEINFYTPTKTNYKDVNDYSPIMILEYESKRIVLSGDAEKEAEKEFADLAKAGQGKFSVFDSNYSADLISLGHHGSRTSSSQDYLDALTTASSIKNVIIIISCGTGNSYGHPHNETIERLLSMGATESNILRTDINGNIAMSIRQDDAGAYQLFYGAEMVKTNYDKPIAWREIAIIIFAGAALIIIVQPLLKSNSKSKKKKK